MKGLTIRRFIFYFLFTITTVLCCSGNLAFAKAVAPITAYLSKKSLVTQKEPLNQIMLMRSLEPHERVAMRIRHTKSEDRPMMRNAGLFTKQSDSTSMSLL